jgi:hypothetical protein
MDRAALDVIAARIAEQAAFNRTITDPLQAQEYARETAQAQRILAAHLSVLHLQQQHNILKMEQKIAEMKPSKRYALTLHHQSFGRQASHDVKQMGISPRK